MGTNLGSLNVNKYMLGKYYKGINYDNTILIFKIVDKWTGHIQIEVVLDKDDCGSSRYEKGEKLSYHQGETIPKFLMTGKPVDEKNIIWEML